MEALLTIDLSQVLDHWFEQTSKRVEKPVLFHQMCANPNAQNHVPSIGHPRKVLGAFIHLSWTW